MSITRIICPDCKYAIAWCECGKDYDNPFNRWWELNNIEPEEPEIRREVAENIYTLIEQD